MNLRTLFFGLILAANVIPASGYGQTYFTTLGLRLGNGDPTRMVGLTAQQRIARKITLEGIIQTDFNRNTTGHLMLQGHQNILSRRLNLYVGAGPSVGTEVSTFEDKETRQIITTVGNNTVGVDLAIGAELTLIGYNITVDYKPNFNVVGREPWITTQVGISVRGVLISNKNQKKRIRERKRSQRQDDRQEAREKRQKKRGKNNDKPWLEDWYRKVFKKDKKK